MILPLVGGGARRRRGHGPLACCASCSPKGERLSQAEIRHLAPEHRRRFEAIGPRAVADWIAGMTDRFAIREHGRLFGTQGGWSET